MIICESSLQLIQQIKLAKFTLTIKATEKIVLPEFKGSAFRGVLGWRLKKVICSNQQERECSQCLLASKCLFNNLFSPPLPPGSQFVKNSSNIPSPIIIEPPLTRQRHFETGEVLKVGLVLIGKGIDYLPYLIYVFSEMGKGGIGAPVHEYRDRKRGGRFELTEVADSMTGKVIYNRQEQVLQEGYKIFSWQEAQENNYKPSKLTLVFQTPVRIKQLHGSRSKLSGLESFSQIMVSLYWRFLMLAYFHCNKHSLDDERFSNLSQRAKEQRKRLSTIHDVFLSENQTYWQDYTRRSNRQKSEMQFGGFMGSATFEGDYISYIPLLTLGEYIHIGKQTMFGMGKYCIQQEGSSLSKTHIC